MSGAKFHAIMLGPQRFTPTVGEVVARFHCRGPVAVVTAGWQEREPEDEELREAIGLPAVNLRLHARAEEVFAAHPELFQSHRERQDRLRQLQHLYRRRLRYAMDAVRELQGLVERPPLGMSVSRLQDEVRAALAAVCDLDRRHQAQVAEVLKAHRDARAIADTPELARHQNEVKQLIEQSDVVAIAGGHVASLLNRLRLFEVARALPGRHLLAWSAGAMVLGEEIVLFHDCPPQGQGDAEILGAGLGVLPNVLALPHASRRLLLDDRERVDRFARRFAPKKCIALDPGGEVAFVSSGAGPWELAEVRAPVLQEGGICN